MPTIDEPHRVGRRPLGRLATIPGIVYLFAAAASVAATVTDAEVASQVEAEILFDPAAPFDTIVVHTDNDNLLAEARDQRVIPSGTAGT